MHTLNKLTEAQIRNAPRREKPYSLSDGRGLALIVNPNGAKYWRFRFRFGLKAQLTKGKNTEKEQEISCGVYPEVSLREARQQREKFRERLRQRIHPKAPERAAKLASANTVKLIGEEYLAFLESPPANSKRRPMNPKTLARARDRLRKYLFPALGSRPLAEVTVPELYRTLQKIEDQGLFETCKRVRQWCGKIWRYAGVTGRSPRDITPELRGSLLHVKHQHYAAITEPERAGHLLRAIQSYRGHCITKLALRLMPILFTRTIELRKAKWQEFDLKRGTWTIPAERIKQRKSHLVPLPKQALSILNEAQELTGHWGGYVFPNVRNRKRPMSSNTINSALHALGFQHEMTGHGFRTLASTTLNAMGVPPDIIELQLSHQEENETRDTYNHAKRLPERRQMMQIWADVLDQWRQSEAGTEEIHAVRIEPIFRSLAALSGAPNSMVKTLGTQATKPNTP